MINPNSRTSSVLLFLVGFVSLGSDDARKGDLFTRSEFMMQESW
jgi:hypothetical protein